MKPARILAALLTVALLTGALALAEDFVPMASGIIFYEPETFAKTFNQIANDLGYGSLAIYPYQYDEGYYYTYISDCGFSVLYGLLDTDDPTISVEMLVRNNADFDMWTKGTSLFAQTCTSLGFSTRGFGEFAQTARDGDAFSCDSFQADCTRYHFENEAVSGERYEISLHMR